MPLDRHLGVGERLLDLAGVELPDVALVRLEVVVHERSVGVERAADVRDRSERLVLDLDELRRVLRDLPRVGDDHCHAVADVPCLVERQREVRRHPDLFGDGPGARQRARPVGRELGAAERGDDALQLARRLQLDPLDRGVRIRAADDRQPELAGKIDVVDELAVPGDELVVLLARDRSADERGCVVRVSVVAICPLPYATAAALCTASTMFW